ncbi:MAG: hypothetical protein KC492_28125, partial [Myxococcales bacterium]|nr:hypothetical protein [Myxococcales bacterium]
MTKFRAVSGIVGLSLIAACGDPNASGLGGSSDRAGATGGTDTGGSSGAGAGGYIEPGTGGGGGTELGSRGGMGQMPHASCSDSVTNGNESDTDCGGFCAPCAVGLACNGASDCDSSSCLSGTCAAPTC